MMDNRAQQVVTERELSKWYLKCTDKRPRLFQQKCSKEPWHCEK